MYKFQTKANQEIRDRLDECGIKQYDLARMLGITEFTLSRKLREELPEDQKKKILELIENTCKK